LLSRLESYAIATVLKHFTPLIPKMTTPSNNRHENQIEQCDYFLIVDLEATCCDDHSFPRQEMEIIEIGAVLVERISLRAIDEFQTFVQPQRHPQLTGFCSALTSIKDAQLSSAPTFPEAVALLTQWLQPYHNYLFCSWGEFDKYQIMQDCAFHQLPYPMPASHLNIKKRFSDQQGIDKKVSMARALTLAGLPLLGTHHRGIDDARNMVQLMPYIVGNRRLPPRQ